MDGGSRSRRTRLGFPTYSSRPARRTLDLVPGFDRRVQGLAGVDFLWRKEKPRSMSCGVLGKDPGDDLLLHGLSHTTIGAAVFHFRVRDGIGWCHSAVVTRERVEGRGFIG